mmetsp:Transcript_34144/g.51508  ORF Transcript_34144/g.51508 Transcript_34144/m.51508 type:complete len:220 (-) Transcript_34144:307-966(-)|eukprot:CAMPEP_0206463298 /NCGR_PEP_ID=MMETSP0324_2-20121206/26511_1 /ASSEMBLY_ACC=CAM_ASM_000836 /TAXON_ID=2866 /ORGANISM="Crypthecodinium cohnii, Strain Seligo" /LENGTH=219 /DNA_ID=CAMNT_0053935659 /DNA_START=71 /DNA_END=730 /DNA_ORIENTATION=-
MMLSGRVCLLTVASLVMGSNALHDKAATETETSVESFEIEARKIHEDALNRIRALAEKLQSDHCVYKEDLKDPMTAIQKFSDCVRHIKSVAEQTVASAAKRGRLNTKYGTATEASLSQMQTTMRSINRLQKSIVTEHKVASDHLAKEVTMIQDQISTIESDNEGSKSKKGWMTKEDAKTKDDGFARSEEAVRREEDDASAETQATNKAAAESGDSDADA